MVACEQTQVNVMLGVRWVQCEERHITGVGLIECKLYSIDSDIQVVLDRAALFAHTVRLQ
jgi:hypothetical protein